MLTIYSKPNCLFCNKAKHFLSVRNIEYVEIDISKDQKAREFILSEGHRTVPQLYLDNKLFVEGGFAGLEKLDDETLKLKIQGYKVD